MSPSAADLSKLVPPTFALPSPTFQDNIVTVTLLQKNWLAVVEDVEQRIIVEDIDKWASSAGAPMDHKRVGMNTMGERSIPEADCSKI